MNSIYNIFTPLSNKIFLGELLSNHRNVIMGLSMISIIMFHQNIVGGFPTGIFHKFGYWGVDVFLFLSGIGMIKSLKSNSILFFYKRRFLRIVPTCLYCGILKVLLLCAFDKEYYWGRTANFFMITGLDLWYIRAILFYYIISPFLYYIFKKNTIYSIIGITVLFFINGIFFRIHNSESFTWIIERLLVFSLGITIAINSHLINKTNFLFSFIFLCIAIGITLIYGRSMTSNTIWTLMMFFLALGSLSLLTIGILLATLCKRFLLLIPNLLGKISLELYLLHEFVIYWAKYYFSEIINPLLLLVLCVLLCICLALTIQKTTDLVK